MNRSVVALLIALGTAMLAMPVAACAAELELDHADFHARLGMRIAARVGPVAPEVSMRAELTDGAGTTRTVFAKGGRLAAR